MQPTAPASHQMCIRKYAASLAACSTPLLGVMRLTVVALLIGLSAKASADDYLWFERTWISDPAATFAANPEYRKLPDDLREKFRGLFGKMLWRVSDGIVEVVPPDGPSFSRPYFIRPIDENSFELTMSDGETEIVRRRGEGFCLETELLGAEGSPKPYVVECFGPHDA